jgi:PAS domain S-box-containing protein
MYSVLIIENDPDDAELIQIELKKLQGEFEFRVVASGTDLSEELKIKKPDIIICDHNLDSFTGKKALGIVQKADPFIPFILCSGYIGEEEAVEYIKQGAADYVLKDRIKRLSNSVLKELENSELKKERETDEQILRFQANLLNEIGEAVIATDINGVITYWNRSAEKLYGWTSTEVIGRDLLNVTPTEMSRQQAEDIIEELKQGKKWSGEFQVQRKDGSVFPAYVTDTPVFNDEGELIAIIGISKDLTSQKIREEKTEQSQRLLQSITDQAQSAVWVRDREGRHFFVNKRFANLFGLKVDDIIGKTVYDLFDEKTANKFSGNDKKIINEGKSRSFEEEVDTKAGVRYYLTNMFPLKGIPGLNDAIAGIAIDITEQKKAELQLQEAEEKLRMIIEHSTSLFFIHTTEHENIYISPQSEQIFGYRPDEMMKEWTDFVTDHPVNKRAMEITEKTIRTGQPQPPYEMQIRKKNGDLVWVEVFESPVVKKGKTVAIAGSLTDISDRKIQDLKIRESLRENQTLLAEIHHRVKNNLAIVSAMLQLQAHDEDSKEVEKRLMDSVSRIRTIANIHENLYQSNTFSRINFEENLRSLTSHIIDGFTTAKQVDFHLELDSVQLNINQAIPFSLIANEVIINAIKHAFTGRDKGKINIRLEQTNRNIRLQIIDDGVGLPEELKIRGNSFGFQIIQVLAKQLKGEYEFQRLNQGTVFNFTFEKAEIKGSASSLL